MADKTGGDSMEIQFASNTSCHGFGGIINSTNKPQKIFWICVTILGFALTLWQIGDRFEDYFDYSTTSEYILEWRNNMSFPAVTFCNYNKYQKSKLTKNDTEYIRLMGKVLYQVINSENEIAYAEEEERNITQRFYPDGFNPSDITNRTGWNLDYIQCAFGDFRKPEMCSKKNFSLTYSNWLGKCYKFTTNEVQKQPGSKYGLRLVFDIKQHEYTEKPSLLGNTEAGLKFLVHPTYEYPDIVSKGVGVSPGTSTYAGIRVEEVQNLEPNWGKCNKSAKLEYFHRYTRSNCASECVAKIVGDKCGCRRVDYPDTGYPYCSVVQEIECTSPTAVEIDADFEAKCPLCKVGCNVVDYPTSVSYAKFPSSSAAGELAEFSNVTTEYLKNNVLTVAIYFEDLTYKITKINPGMTPSGLLSDIGGQLGLFIGMSCLTLIEFFEYFVKKIHEIRLKSHNSNKKEKQATIKGKNLNGDKVNATYDNQSFSDKEHTGT